MAKYIDADKAKNGVMEFVDEHGEIVGMFVNDFNILLERCAVDAQEVRHGRWIEQEADMDTIYECSVCGEPFVTIEGTPADNLWHYCPNCGAKMDEDDNYCDDENCEIYQRDLNCERCNK